jgi:hypothetical protein
MSAPLIISEDYGLFKFLRRIGLQVCLSKPQIFYLLYILAGLIGGSNRLTIANIHRTTLCNRQVTCMTRFLSESQWDEDLVNRYRKEYIHERLTRRVSQDAVGFWIIDDSTVVKNRNTKHIEGLDYHFSHLNGETTWCHQTVSSMYVIRGMSFPMDVNHYLRKDYCIKHGMEFKSKIDLAIEQLENFTPISGTKTYALHDCWYTAIKLIEAELKKGIHAIGAIKTNRLICPKGINISIAEFLQYIRRTDLRTVTADGKKYEVYRYEGKVSKIDNAVILMCWQNGYDRSVKPFCILCTDVELETEKIIAYYSVRWNIETGYAYLKERFGVDHYQVRSLRAIRRLWIIAFLAHTYLEFHRTEHHFSNLGEAIDHYRRRNTMRLINYIYTSVTKGVSFKEICETLGVAA